MAEVVQLRPSLYEAKTFRGAGFQISGTLCGHIDLATPGRGTYILSPDEVHELIIALQGARQDVLANSRPLTDPRLYDVRPA